MKRSEDSLDWTSACGTGACVEVAPDGDVVYLRDSKTRREQPPISIPTHDWGVLLASIRAGDLDAPTEAAA